MRRFLLALAVLLAVSATPALAGYIIIRVLLVGGSAPGGAGGTEGVPGGPSSYGPPGVSTGGRGPSMGGPPMPGTGGTGVPPAAAAGDFDHTRSVVVVIPVELAGTRKQDLPRAKLFPPDPRLGQFPPELSKEYEQIDFAYRGLKLGAPLFVDSVTIQVYDELLGKPGPRQTRVTEVRDRYRAWEAGKKNPQLLYEAMLLALQHGLVPQAVDYAKELVLVADAKALPLSEPATRFAAIWKDVSRDLAAGTERSPVADEWSRRLERYLHPIKVYHQGHFTLFAGDNLSGVLNPEVDPKTKTKTLDILRSEVERRLDQLNENMAAFYMWHATRGVRLKVPDQALLVALAPDEKSVPALRSALDCLPGDDAFFAPEHELLVLSRYRTDSVGRTFQRQSEQVFRPGLIRERLVKKQYPPITEVAKSNLTGDDIAHAATIAAVDVLVREEFEVAAISREGTRQLLYASGVMPRHVALPNWLANGAVNFLARPRGPAYVTAGPDDKPVMHVAMSTGYGTPNFVLNRYFRDLREKQEVPQVPGENKEDAAKLLTNVLTDTYFAALKSGEDPDPAPLRVVRKTPATPPPGTGATGTAGGGLQPIGQPPGGPGGGLPAGDPDGPRGSGSGGAPRPGVPPVVGSLGGPLTDPIALQRSRQQRLGIKANATSWALYFYLAREKPAELKAYLAELDRLPRDLPVDGATAMETFVRAFKLSSVPDGPADPARFKAFATEWLDYMKTVALTGEDVPLVAPKVAASGGPGGSGINPLGAPGGSPGSGPRGGDN